MASTIPLPCLLLCSLLGLCGVVACGGDATTTTEATTAPATTTSGATEAATSAATTVETTTTSGPGTSSPTTSAETSATTSMMSETTAIAAETGETTAGETTGTTGEPGGATCEQDSDCQLYTDCCTCDVLAAGEEPPACGLRECLVPICETLDIGAGTPVCRFGRCTFEKVSCNPLAVSCKAQQPDCPAGQVPSVQGDCWTGRCAPVEACDWVPDCDACAEDPSDPLVCVLKGQKGAYFVCEPKPVGCGDAPEIDCACGAEICEASPPHDVCSDHTPGIVCECPNC
jgi:hypothetical protein